MTTPNIYTAVVKRVLNDTEHLPGLPRLTLAVRRELANEHSNYRQLAALIRNEPGLTALLFKYAASPMYRTRVKITSLDQAIALLGHGTVLNIVMLHSVRGLFVTRSRKLQALYQPAWRRQVTKAGLSCFLARQFSLNSDTVLVQSLMTELGSLAVISAFKEIDDSPDYQTYVELCRAHSKSLTLILMKKWGFEEDIVEAVGRSGNWQHSEDGPIDELDVMNLALYHTVRWTEPAAKLPELASLAAFSKLPAHWQRIDEQQCLVQLSSHRLQIDAIIDSLTSG